MTKNSKIQSGSEPIEEEPSGRIPSEPDPSLQSTTTKGGNIKNRIIPNRADLKLVSSKISNEPK